MIYSCTVRGCGRTFEQGADHLPEPCPECYREGWRTDCFGNTRKTDPLPAATSTPLSAAGFFHELPRAHQVLELRGEGSHRGVPLVRLLEVRGARDRRRLQEHPGRQVLAGGPVKGLWKSDLVVLGALALGAIAGHLLPAEEERGAEAGAGLELSPRQPPRVDRLELMRRDCRRSGREFIAWRGDGNLDWRYACVSAWLRPEQILGL